MTTPNPGSQQAQDQGCLCPIMDNHYGQGIPAGDGSVMFVQMANCPLHGYVKTNKHDDH